MFDSDRIDGVFGQHIFSRGVFGRHAVRRAVSFSHDFAPIHAAVVVAAVAQTAAVGEADAGRVRRRHERRVDDALRRRLRGNRLGRCDGWRCEDFTALCIVAAGNEAAQAVLHPAEQPAAVGEADAGRVRGRHELGVHHARRCAQRHGLLRNGGRGLHRLRGHITRRSHAGLPGRVVRAGDPAAQTGRGAVEDAAVGHVDRLVGGEALVLHRVLLMV